MLATNLQLGLSGRRLISQPECLRLRVSQSSESIEDSFLKWETANWQSVHSKLSQIGDRISRKSKVLRNLVLQTKLLCSADEVSGEVTACSHCLQPGFFRVSQLVDSRVLNPSYIDEDSFLNPMAVSHSVEGLQERALVINRRQPNCNC